MQEWADIANYQITELAKTDETYRQLLAVCQALEPEYLAVMEKLPLADREVLERYISACEEKEHRFAQLAYDFGKTRL